MARNHAPDGGPLGLAAGDGKALRLEPRLCAAVKTEIQPSGCCADRSNAKRRHRPLPHRWQTFRHDIQAQATRFASLAAEAGAGI